MRLILFIGHFKTGSTSIQHYFARNWLGLLQRGVLYPAVESQAVSRAIRLSLQGRDEDLQGQGLNIVEPHNALALRLKNEDDGHSVPSYYPHPPSGFQMFEMIRNQIGALNPETTVLCSEVFALLGMTAQRSGVKRIHARLGQHDTTIYCSLRRPDEYLSSWHRQRLKFGEKLAPLRAGALRSYVDTAHFQQAKLVRGWMDGCFEDSTLILRNFEDIQKGQGSIVDFMTQTRIPAPANAVIPGMMNPSVPAAFAEIGRLALHALPREQALNIVHWLTSMRRVVPHPSDREVEVFGQPVRNVLVEMFRPVARDLSAMAGGTGFYTDLDDLSRVRPIPELDAVRVSLPLLVAASKISRLTQPERDWLSTLQLPDQ